MVGIPEAGGYVLASGSRALFETHRATLDIPLTMEFVGTDAGHAALQDVALLSGMYGTLAGVTHALALVRGETGIAFQDFTPRLVDWLMSMASTMEQISDQVASGNFPTDTVASLSMQSAGVKTFVDTAHEQGISPELLTPYFALMKRRVEQGHGNEGVAGLVELLAIPGTVR
ncbi:hypothetical protein ABT354_01315 [Streptomyces sp. NPDC000594]|uniref:imine reductase family protein n=1 Tax=Streptomyces sp. NPDC000594 TaxID=3154261 RepID=UPI003321C362